MSDMSGDSAAEGQLLPPPFINIEGINNFRDLGGYNISAQPTRSIKRNLIYRSAQPSQVTDRGIATLQELGITHIYDLRSKNEVQRNKLSGRGDVVDWTGCQREFVPVFEDRDYDPESLAIRYRNYASEGTEVDGVLPIAIQTVADSVLGHRAFYEPIPTSSTTHPHPTARSSFTWPMSPRNQCSYIAPPAKIEQG